MADLLLNAKDFTLDGKVMWGGSEGSRPVVVSRALQ
jgi:hypothetical protein